MESPDRLHRILRNYSVTGHDYKAFFQCLCDKKPVKRVSVDVRKRLYALEMGYVNCDATKTCQLTLSVKVRQNQFRIELLKRLLDCYLPQ